ncbi:MAG: hypothetical protein AB1757_06150 [Acidobacteriota bacterium]
MSKNFWRGLLCLLAFFITLPFSVVQSDGPTKDARFYRQQAMAAYKAKNYAAFAENLEKALQFTPDHPTLLYNLAIAYALLNRPQAALQTLATVADMGLIYPAEKNADFDALKNSEAFQAIIKRFAGNRAPLVKSEWAFGVEEKGLIPEGLAYDPTSQTFYLSSIHQRKIFAINRQGEARVFAEESQGLWAVAGMKVDAKRKILWAATAAVGQMVNLNREDEGRSGVLQFDLRTGKLLKRFEIRDRAKKHWLGDVAINSRGEVFATDSLAPALYRIRPHQREIEPVIEGEPFVSPQGLAFSSDEKHLFVADYAKGIFEIEVTAKRAIKLAPPVNATLLGIDGLYFYQGDLLAVQNGVNPHRLIRLKLNDKLNAITKVDLVEANNPQFAEPTLGVVVKDAFYFIANSQWDLIDDHGKFASLEKLQPVRVLKMKL